MYGTMTTPQVGGEVPGVVFIAGSGPTDRNWISPLLPGTNGSAALIAHALAEEGFASLRYDKRASGPHVAENFPQLMGKLSMETHRDEVASAVEQLAQQPAIRTERIFALANSEGTLHALNYQRQKPGRPFAGLILTGPPGRSVGAVARSQLEAQATRVDNGDGLLALYEEAIARFLAGQPANPDPALPEGVRALIQSLESPANLPFSRELWTTDASLWLRDVNVPTLIIIGKKDLQVDYQIDGAALRTSAQGNLTITFSFPDNANHVLKYEPRPRSALRGEDVGSRYNANDAELDRETMDAILHWLGNQAH
ncbi:MAG: alpha/beta hydrolase [Sulfobacillus acidophilus]|uniref:Alpha/beta hydrolase n=1 Tax=Sulfobacillus acidophilus TaxID=53633 RepID=A0A2T2WP12_9FIRM|nr:MAG: alpha/beta hydrolase [Sulfobacillus acidophilus]